MVGKLFGKKSRQSGIFAYAKINARIMPDVRDRRFEQPLIEALARESVNREPIAEVTGAGTLQEKSGELVYCGIDLDLFDLDAAQEFVCAFLTSEGAPKGSLLEYERDGKDIKTPFGENEGLAMYLNGTALPEEVYRTSDINLVMASIDEALAHGEAGSIWGWWQGPRETALYCYGRSFDEMNSRLLPVFAKTALCENCRVVQVA